ncbi:endonuclease/exonuclease/phosphatase family protein [Streptomonospora alba]|uniref:endonuclease/exonuclease/phosphatase family protein n=1 Tax=Streptomonospora alba TaxID=183763 RepID=UPI001EE73BB6|nr:endonuclease/exonuclease/phosphatase family protein [Streptomonospora alba]
MARTKGAVPSSGPRAGGGRLHRLAQAPRALGRSAESGGGRRGWVTAVAAVSVLPWGVWALVRLTGAESGFPAVALIAFTPYVAATSVLPVALALLARRGWVALAAAATAVALVGCVLPRGLPGSAPDAGGPRLTVLSANVYFGLADPDALVRLVREHGVEVLSLQELTPQFDDALTRSGLRSHLPYGVTDAATGPVGGAVYSAHPVDEIGGTDRSAYFAMPRARLRVPDAMPVEVVSTHAMPPSDAAAVPAWRDSLRELPDARPNGRVRVLAGDFNATLDHAVFRSLLDTGYSDAAAATGSGWTATWPVDRPLPGTAIDHILVDHRVAVHRTSVHTVPNTDHRAVLAELTLPRA